MFLIIFETILTPYLDAQTLALLWNGEGRLQLIALRRLANSLRQPWEVTKCFNIFKMNLDFQGLRYISTSIHKQAMITIANKMQCNVSLTFLYRCLPNVGTVLLINKPYNYTCWHCNIKTSPNKCVHTLGHAQILQHHTQIFLFMLALTVYIFILWWWWWKDLLNSNYQTYRLATPITGWYLRGR